MFINQLRQRKESRRRLWISRRMFRRRTVGIRMSFFYQVEVGVALDYLLTVLDKSISLIMMVDGSYPDTMLVF